jgi:hypothetical protein
VAWLYCQILYTSRILNSANFMNSVGRVLRSDSTSTYSDLDMTAMDEVRNQRCQFVSLISFCANQAAFQLSNEFNYRKDTGYTTDPNDLVWSTALDIWIPVQSKLINNNGIADGFF